MEIYRSSFIVGGGLALSGIGGLAIPSPASPGNLQPQGALFDTVNGTGLERFLFG